MKLEYELIQQGYTVCNDQWFVPNESVIYNRIYYVYEGDCLCHYEEQTFSLEKGHIYFFPSMKKYSLEQNPQNPLKVLWFHINVSQDYLIQLHTFAIEEQSILYYYVKLLEKLVEKSDCQTEFIQTFDSFLSMLNKEHPFAKSLIHDMQKAVNYIDENLSEDLTVESLADYLGLDRSFLSRKFKSVFAMSPRDYILSQRLSKGANLLIKGESVYEASKIAGYGDEKSFSRAFKKYMEISPSEYRKKYRVIP